MLFPLATTECMSEDELLILLRGSKLCGSQSLLAPPRWTGSWWMLLLVIALNQGLQLVEKLTWRAVLFASISIAVCGSIYATSK